MTGLSQNDFFPSSGRTFCDGQLFGKGPLEESDARVRRFCEAHGEYFAKVHLFDGIPVHESECPLCHQIKLELERKQEEEEARRMRLEAQRARLARATASLAIPKRFTNAAFENWIPTSADMERVREIAQSYVAKFDELKDRGIGMVFVGWPGTGKTHLACAVLKALVEDVAGQYTQAGWITQRIRETWGDAGRSGGLSEADVRRAYCEAPLLVVDECAREDLSPAKQEDFLQIVDARYLEQRPTIYVCNCEDVLLRQRVGDLAYDRMRETCKLVRFTWLSQRGGKELF